MSDDTDAWVEEEIQRELDALNEGEIESSDPDLTNDLSDASEAQDDDLLPSMQDYFSKVKYQTDKLEAELKECDDLLNESELVSARDANGASEMYLELAVEHGIDPETLRKQVLEELEKEDEENERLLLREDLDEVDVNEEIPTQENELTPEPLENGASIFSTEVHFGLSSDTFGRLERPESNQRGRTAEGADEPSDSLALNADVTEEVVANTENDNDELSNPGQKSSRGDASDTKMAILDSIKPDENKEPALVLGPGQGVVAEVSQFDLLERQALKQLKDITKQRKQKETVWKEEENKRFQTAERIDKENEVKRIDKLTELDKEHKAVLITREEREKKVEAEIKVAQAKYTEELKSYEAEINELAKQAEKEKEEFRIALQEENIKREEKRLNAAVKIQSCYRGHRARATHGDVVKVRIEESKLIREQERIIAIETEREGQKRIEQQKMEEEIVKKQHEEEERKRKQEDEIKAKELEEKRKADEKKRKLEEERKKKEEMEMKKAEEERKRAEDRRRKEEEDRWRKQEEERKKEEEKRRKEEEKRQKEEADRKKREEEQKRIEEERTRLEEEKKRREDEERKRLDELKRKEEEERKRKEEEERKIRLEEERRQEEERKKKERHLKQIGKLGPVNGHAADRSVFEDWGECLPLSIEQKRLGWMKECKPWSKTLSELKGKKPSSSKRPPRRPISAKKFPLLDEKSILSGANVATLQQVTTVELSDLPGCSLKTLSQCVSLKSLIMNNCNIVALDGLGDCKTLHYIDIKHNKCEMVNVKDMITLVYLDVSHNCLSNIHGLDGCSSLKYVDMSHNRITRIGGLETLKKLHTFKLSSNQLITTRGLSEAPTVQELDLSNNHLPNVDDIDNLGLLQSLNVSGNNLLQFPKLMNHVLLQRLVLNSNSISNLSSMETAWLPSLTHLEITQNSIASLSDISSACINLQHLNLSHNQILELEPLIAVLSKHRHLQYLSVDGNPAAEEHGAKDSLTLRLGRLVELDSKRTGSKETAINLTTFEKMCKSQVTESANLKSSFARTLKAARMKDYAQVHHKHFTKSNQVAAEHRFAHEYGDMSVKASQEMRQSVEKKPSPSVNPKDSFAEAISQGRALAPTPPQEKPPPKPNQASQMKNKFEEALMNANKPAMEPPTSSVAVRNPQVTANSVGNILKDEGVINQERARNKAATKIQARFRGYSIRKEIEERTQHALAAMEEQDARNRQRMGPPDGAPPEPPLGEKRISIDSTPVTNKAAALIQALWRGYILRKKLMMALSYARFEDMDDDMPDMDIDLNAFEFNEADLDKGWTPPETPQLPKSTPVIGQPVSRTMMETRPPEVPVLYEKPPHPPEQPRQAWRGQSPMHANGKLPPLPPQSRLSEHSEQYTQRTALSKKEEQITEEWGFNNSRTAELMMARAKKLKYNSDKKKKFGKLDPKQRLALFRKLEETTKIKPVQPLSRKQAPRKEYFKAREEEFANQEREKRMEVTTKVDRTFEWVHTQVGSHDIESARDDGHRMSSGGYYSSDNNLPRIENTGRRTVLTASPSLDLQSIESASFTGDVPKPRRLSMQDHGDRLPPIKTSSAPSSRPGERLSWRGKEIKKSGGWGGGKKRTK